MNKNLSIIAEELFDKIRTQFPNLKLGDEESKVTSNPEDARFFEFDFKHDDEVLGKISVSLDEKDGLVVIYSNDVVGNKNEYVKKKFFNFLKELREFAKQHLLTFDTRDIVKSNLEKRDYKFLSNKTGETNMSESKLFGTSMTSYQNLGNAKLIVKHSAPVNFENPAGRAQRIESIYVENVEGERFKYPYRHLNGARALAQHIGHGGTPYDGIGQHITGLSEELGKLRMFKQYVERNDMVSEAMGNINSKVMERIDAVKKEIHSLQVSRNYEQFAESFTETEAKQIPEEIMNDWIDRLTVRTFNEELKNVFPYIFKLVDESDIPVKELGAEDLISVVETAEESVAAEIPEFAEYESYLNSIVEDQSDLFGPDNQELIDQLNQLIAEPIPVGVDATNAIESLQDIINDDELMDIFTELADVSPEADVRSILKDYITMKDEENGTSVMSNLTFGSDSAETPAVEPEPATEPAPVAQEPAPVEEPAAVEEPVMADIYSEEKEEDDNDPPFDADKKPSKDVTPGKAGQGHSKARHLARKGMQSAIEKAKKAGATAETVIRIAGKEMTLGEAVEMAGMKVEDVFGNKANELVEFVKSMYNSDEGSFPKGETGVLIACEKKFGESSIHMAKKVIGELHQVNEMNRMKKLAGMDEADALRSRIGTNIVNKHPRQGQTDMRNIPVGNRPDNTGSNKFTDKDRAAQQGNLKSKIKGSLGKHPTPNLPEDLAAMMKIINLR